MGGTAMSTTPDPAPEQSQQLKDAIKFVQEHPGLYWLSNQAVPGQAIPCISMAGKIHQLKLDGELRPQYFENSALLSGPLPFPP